MLHHNEYDYTMYQIVMTATPSQSASNFTGLYETELNTSSYEATTVSAIAFDAVWALAEALNKTEEMRKYNQSISNCTDSEGDLVPLDQFNYSNGLMGCVLKHNLHQTDFLGVSVCNNLLYA